jgi:hypothetical protein
MRNDIKDDHERMEIKIEISVHEIEEELKANL